MQIVVVVVAVYKLIFSWNKLIKQKQTKQTNIHTHTHTSDGWIIFGHKNPNSVKSIIHLTWQIWIIIITFWLLLLLLMMIFFWLINQLEKIYITIDNLQTFNQSIRIDWHKHKEKHKHQSRDRQNFLHVSEFQLRIFFFN